MLNQMFLFSSGFCYVGDPESFVMGHIINGQFDGSFVVFEETFHLEPVQRYGIGLNASFHSIVFSSSSVEFDFSRIRRKMARFPQLYHHVKVKLSSVKVNNSKNVFALVTAKSLNQGSYSSCKLLSFIILSSPINSYVDCRHSTTSFSKNVVLADTSYTVL